MSNWTEKKLGDISKIITGPFGTQLHKSDYTSSGVAVIMPQNISSRKFSYENIVYISEEDANRLKRYIVKQNDIVYARRGNIEKHAFISETEEGELCGTGCFLVRIDSNEVIPEFISFYLDTPKIKKWILSNAVGSNMPNLNTDILKNVPIKFPDKQTQKDIVRTLSLISMKIQINREINEIISKQVQTLYDYWFTQYNFLNENGNPYQSSGGQMIYNQKLNQKIPYGWNVIEVREITKIKSGYAFSSEDYSQDGKYRLITIKNVKSEGIDIEVDNFIKTIPNNMPEYCKLKTGDILMSLTGNVGRVGIMFSKNCLLNQRVAIIDPLSSENKYFIYSLFKSEYMRAKLLNLANGSSQANLSPVETEKIMVAYNSDIAVKFNKIIHPFINELINKLEENQQLFHLKDWLLPMLMNGQVSVSN